MISRSSTNRKRSESALVNVTNVHKNSHNNRIKPEPNHQNILSTNCKRTNIEPLSSIANSHQTNNKRIKLCNKSQQVNVNSQLSNRSIVNRAFHLHNLPFDCLSSILSRISLHHRITRLCLVCHHLKSTVDQMCTIKGQLTINLFENYKPRIMQLATSDLEKYWRNVRSERMESLILNNRNCPFPDLSVRFPLITQLVIRSNDTTKYQNSESLKQLLSLLGQQTQEWFSSLTSLTLWKMTKIIDPNFLPQLCTMINHKFNQSSLKQLNLYIQGFGPATCAYHPERVKLTNVLPQLERFFVHCTFKNWPSVMRTLGDPTKMTKVGVKEIQLIEYSLSHENWTNLFGKTKLTSTVTQLHLTGIMSREWFSLICQSFGLLQFLQIYVCNNKLDANWLTDLHKLPNLTELKMHRFQLDPIKVNFVPLSTIKKLTICDSELLTKFQTSAGSNRFNASQYCRLLSHHFPSLSVLVLFSNEKRVTMAGKNIRKWAQVHFKQIKKVVLVLQAEEYRNNMRALNKFMREYRKSLRN